MLHEFLTAQHEAIVAAARVKLLARAAPLATEAVVRDGVPLFLRQLEAILRREQATTERPAAVGPHPVPSEMSASANRQGGELLEAGFTVAQVVQGYGDICQAITDLATALDARITSDEFRTLNRCLDEVIAEAVTEFSRQRDRSIAREHTERLGIFAHELRNLLNNAQLGYEMLKTGTVGVASSTGQMLGRSLLGLRDLIDVSLAQVRLEAGENRRDLVDLAEFMEEVELVATIQARAHHREVALTPVSRNVSLHVDRQLLAAALGNLLQNAFKFSRPYGRVLVRTDSTTDPARVRIEVEDQCGGLPPAFVNEPFRPYVQRASDQSGLGLGLLIARKGVEASGGILTVRDLPGVGCVFTIDLPQVTAEALRAAG
jgi:signal transduction histidine kinase